MITDKINKKRSDKIREIESEINGQIKALESKYNNNQKLYKERMQKLEAEKILYNKILTDMQKNHRGMINNCINEKYRI